MKLTLIISAAITAAIGVLLSPVAAQAEEVRHADARRDVLAVDESGQTAAPGNRRADITRADGFYGNGTVSAAAIYRNLVGRGTNTTVVRIRTSAGENYSLTLRSTGPTDSPTLTFREGADVRRCRGKSFAFDPAGDKTYLAVPARCVGRPEWVRFGVLHTWNANQAGDIPVFVDDGHLDGEILGATTPPALGPRVSRN